MDIPKRTPQGQVVQENSPVLGSDSAPVNEEVGNALRMQIVDGKDGSITKIALPQTDYTDAHAGAAPPYEGAD
jgi:hypothetical protein